MRSSSIKALTGSIEHVDLMGENVHGPEEDDCGFGERAVMMGEDVDTMFGRADAFHTRVDTIDLSRPRDAGA